MILIIDNFDSFTYNLYQAVGVYNPDIKVVRNDEYDAGGIESLAPDKIIISPGPGEPTDTGCVIEVIRKLGHKIPILGICLGHQAIACAYGGTVGAARRILHGKSTPITLNDGCKLFEGLGGVIGAARYHSLAITDLPQVLEVTAVDECGEIMGVKHREYNVFGLQFHPESILTDKGEAIIKNFVEGL